jgi:MFS family permease
VTKRPRRSLAAPVIVGGYAASVAAGALLYHLNHSAQRDLSGAVSNLVAYTTFTAMGTLIIARRPGHRIGWLFSAIGLSATLAVLAEEYAKYTLVTSPGSLPFGFAAAWMTNWLWAPSVVLPTTFLLLLFPDGHLASRRWRPVAWLAAGILATVLVANALAPGPLDSFPRFANPLGIDLLGGVLDRVLALAGALYLGVTASCVAAVVVRFRRSRGEERQQLKWFAYAAGLLLIFLLLNVLAGDPNNLFFGVGLTLFPLATGIAVLRYRLYDIDRLISRTLVYGLLTALLAGIYGGAVLVLGQVFGGVGGIRRAGWWPAPLWRWRRCSSRCAAGSRPRWIGASTGAASTLLGPSRHSASGCAMRSTWTCFQPNSSPSWIRRCSPLPFRCGSSHQPRLGRAAEGHQQADLTQLDPCMPCSFGLLPHPRSEP